MNRPKTYSITSLVDGGRLKTGREALSKAIQTFEGREVTITIAQPERPRSDRQNKYYWSCIIPFFRDAIEAKWGDRISKQEAHEILKEKFNSVERVNEATGEILRIPKTTKDNSTYSQEVYHEDCRRFILEFFSIEVPLPNENVSLNFGD